MKVVGILLSVKNCIFRLLNSH